MVPPSSHRDLLERLAEEFTQRRRRGEQPTIDEYCARYPDLAEDIRALFPTLMMEKMASVHSALTDSANAAASEQPAIPSRLGEYRIIRELGRGGMGIVYEAVQESLGRHVALKVLPFHALMEPTHLARFRREAQAAARLHHTNIVPVFGVGEHEGIHFF